MTFPRLRPRLGRALALLGCAFGICALAAGPLPRVGLPEPLWLFESKFSFKPDGSLEFAPGLNVNQGDPYPVVVGTPAKP